VESVRHNLSARLDQLEDAGDELKSRASGLHEEVDGSRDVKRKLEKATDQHLARRKRKQKEQDAARVSDWEDKVKELEDLELKELMWKNSIKSMESYCRKLQDDWRKLQPA
jgi:chromosome segregation ATPase